MSQLTSMISNEISLKATWIYALWRDLLFATKLENRSGIRIQIQLHTAFLHTLISSLWIFFIWVIFHIYNSAVTKTAEVTNIMNSRVHLFSVFSYILVYCLSNGLEKYENTPEENWIIVKSRLILHQLKKQE